MLDDTEGVSENSEKMGYGGKKRKWNTGPSRTTKKIPFHSLFWDGRVVLVVGEGEPLWNVVVAKEKKIAEI